MNDACKADDEDRSSEYGLGRYGFPPAETGWNLVGVTSLEGVPARVAKRADGVVGPGAYKMQFGQVRRNTSFERLNPRQQVLHGRLDYLAVSLGRFHPLADLQDEDDAGLFSTAPTDDDRSAAPSGHRTSASPDPYLTVVVQSVPLLPEWLVQRPIRVVPTRVLRQAHLRQHGTHRLHNLPGVTGEVGIGVMSRQILF